MNNVVYKFAMEDENDMPQLEENYLTEELCRQAIINYICDELVDQDMIGEIEDLGEDMIELLKTVSDPKSSCDDLCNAWNEMEDYGTLYFFECEVGDKVEKSENIKEIEIIAEQVKNYAAFL